MTFTFPLINAARNVLLLVTGEDKAHAIQILLGDDEEAKKNIPAAYIHPTHGQFKLVMDSAAARLTGM